jgi:predicted ribosomally synthesized peptide with nif11-like leader
MPQATVTQFIQAIEQDPDLKAKLQAAVDSESYQKIINEYGYHFTAEELETELSQQKQEKLVEIVNPGVEPRQHLGDG